MGIREIERFEARSEDTAVSCAYVDRGTFEQFIIHRVNLNVTSDQSSMEFANIDEIRDLRNVLNDMIASVEAGNFVGGAE